MKKDEMNLDEAIKFYEDTMAANIDTVASLLELLPDPQLFSETQTLCEIYNGLTVEYNALANEKNEKTTAEPSEECSRPDLIQKFIDVYQEGNQLFVRIKLKKEADRAYADYEKATRGAAAAGGASAVVYRNFNPPISHFMKVSCHNY